MVTDFLKALGAVVGVLVAAFAGVWAYATFLLGPAPDAFSLTMVESPETTKVVIDGFWEVTSGEGGYRAFEVLSGQDNIVVGRTPDIDGDLSVSDGVLTGATFEVELVDVATDSPGRDTFFVGHVDVGQFPTATFVADGGVDISEIAKGPISVEVPGILTFHGVEQALVATVDAQFVGDQVELVATIDFDFTAHGVEAPNLVFAVVEPNAVIEVQVMMSLTGEAAPAPSPTASADPSTSPTPSPSAP